MDRSGERSGHLRLRQGGGSLDGRGRAWLNRGGGRDWGGFCRGDGGCCGGSRCGGRGQRGEQEALHLSVGHGGLHELLPRPRDDGHSLGHDLQLALRLPLALDHHGQTRVSFLCALCQLQELGHGQFDLSLLGSRGLRGCGGSLSCCGGGGGGTGRGRSARLNCSRLRLALMDHCWTLCHCCPCGGGLWGQLGRRAGRCWACGNNSLCGGSWGRGAGAEVHVARRWVQGAVRPQVCRGPSGEDTCGFLVI